MFQIRKICVNQKAQLLVIKFVILLFTKDLLDTYSLDLIKLKELPSSQVLNILNLDFLQQLDHVLVARCLLVLRFET